MNGTDLRAFRDLVKRVMDGPSPAGLDFDACRALLGRDSSGEAAYHALCMLLEGALADASFDIGATQTLVRLLKELARGAIRPEEVLP